MLRLGLCCKFFKAPIRFRTSTAKYLKSFSRLRQLEKISQLCLFNAESLRAAIEHCSTHHIGCFRVNSQLFPLKTHPDVGYAFDSLPDAKEIKKIFSQCRERSIRRNIRLSFHPDQFVILSSPRKDVIQNSIAELDYQAEASELIGADVITIHAGGAYGDKTAALKRLGRVISKLKKRIRQRLAIENDDRIYSPADLLPFCAKYGIPFVYDAHHHRCLPDKLSITEATKLALRTWNREPLFHLSSPKYCLGGPQSRWHHDYIDVHDFPGEWKDLTVTVEVEAKAKELAVERLYKELKLGQP